MSDGPTEGDLSILPVPQDAIDAASTSRFRDLHEELLYCFDKYMDSVDRLDIEAMTARSLFADAVMRMFPKETKRGFYAHKMLIDNMYVSIRVDANDIRIFTESYPYVAHKDFAMTAAFAGQRVEVES